MLKATPNDLYVASVRFASADRAFGSALANDRGYTDWSGTDSEITGSGFGRRLLTPESAPSSCTSLVELPVAAIVGAVQR